MSIASLTTHVFIPPSDPAAATASFAFPALLPIRAGASASDFTQSRSSSGRTLRIHFSGSVSKRNPRKLPQPAAAAAGGDEIVSVSSATDDGDDGAPAATVEQSKRILALQKELLDQIAERKKLVTTLKENLGQAAEQVKTYNKDANVIKTKNSVPVEKPAAEQVKTYNNDASVIKTKNSVPLEKPLKQSISPGTRTKYSDMGSSKSLQYSPAQVSESVNHSSKVVNNKRTETESLSRNKASSPVSRVSHVSIPTKEAPEKKKVLQPAEGNVSSKLKFEEPATTDTTDSKNAKDEPSAADDGINAEEPSAPLAGPNVMNVIVVAAECAPWSKTGGLGDVAGALPKALARRGHRVMVVVPRYGNYSEAFDIGLRKRYNIAGQDMEVGYFHGYIDGVDYVFIDHNSFHGFANNIYEGKTEDVLKRMVLLCKAAVEVPWHVPCGGVCYGDGNLVFIANDWHTALLPVYLQAYYRDNGLMQFTRSVLVIHNMAHQGRGPMANFPLLGLPEHYMDKFNLYDPIGGEHMNVFMAGLITAHRVVAVSHGYAWECQTQEGGWGLDNIMREHNWKLRGIVNGIDEKEWSPEIDVHLRSDGYTNYSIDTVESGKAVCKAALQRELGLPVRNDVPVLGFIGRLDHQKGVDIIADAMHWIMQQDVQLVMLGTGRPDLEEMLRSFEGQHRDKVRAWVGFSVKTAHRITAGCDLLLMPSRFEPCGLNQLYAMKYGTIPVVHAVGGLRDTVQNFDPFNSTGTGWTFANADAGELIHALGNAIWTYRDFKNSWKDLQRRGMSQDLSWDNAAKQYEEVLLAAKYQW